MRGLGATLAIVLLLIGVACLPDTGCRAASAGSPNVILGPLARGTLTRETAVVPSEVQERLRALGYLR